MKKSPQDRYLGTLVSGYGLMVLQIGLSLVTVPLALHYLGKETFGIWALCSQVAFWLQLLDGGMNGAIARYLIDYLEDPQGDGLKECIATGFRVLCAQGAIVFLAAFLLSQGGRMLFGLEGAEKVQFGNVLIILGAVSFLGFILKIFQSWMYAIQRLDLPNYITLGALVMDFAVFWLLLIAGLNVYALAWARVASAALSMGLLAYVAVKVGGFPFRMLWGAWSQEMFRRLATFGGGMFMLTLGTLLLTMSQTALVTKFLGLGAAAVWATAPKLFQVVLQSVSKLWDYRVPHFSTLMAGSRFNELTEGFGRLFRATAYIGGGGLGAVAAINSNFLGIWTNQVIFWDPVNNYLIAIAFYVALLARCITDFVLHTKKVGWMPFLMLLEGLIFVFSAAQVLPRFGIQGMIGCSVVAGGLLRLPYAWVIFRNYLNLNLRSQVKMLADVGGGALFAVLTFSALTGIRGIFSEDSDWTGLIVQCALGAVLVLPISVKLVLSAQRTPGRDPLHT